MGGRRFPTSFIPKFPTLLTPSLRILSLLAHSKSPLLRVEDNHILRYILKNTIYAQFCAGETSAEVRETVSSLKDTGFEGVVLNYAKEILVNKGALVGHIESDEAEDVETWKKGMLKTLEMATEGDYVAAKFSGAGQSVMNQLAQNLPPSTAISHATSSICKHAKSSGTKLLFDAEQDAVQRGIDQWTLDLQRTYNRSGAALIYGTYQAYLKSTPATLAQHLSIAQREGFILGVKLVRGAYMASDPRHLFWATKAETDQAYDRIAEALIRKEWNDILAPADAHGGQKPGFPNVNLVLATHNDRSVRKAVAIRQDQSSRGKEQISLAYAQLMGMADNLSCELLMGDGVRGSAMDKARVYKYVAWGTVRECLTYLLRRAQENREALGRSRESRLALGKELRRRLLRV
ncbi:MAG: hypothetical protein Q9200_003606 [Gallowayella weberi]